jgi:hypothetical protein
MMPPLPPLEARGGPAPRTDSRRWIVVAVAVVATLAGVGATYVFSQTNSCDVCQGCYSSSSQTPLGAGFAIGTPTAEGGTSNHSYWMSVTPASGLVWGEVAFEVRSSSGATLVPAPDWNVSIFPSPDGAGAPIGTYDFVTGQWTAGASVSVTSGQVISLNLGTTDLAGQGDSIVLLGPVRACALTGEVSEGLP